MNAKEEARRSLLRRLHGMLSHEALWKREQVSDVFRVLSENCSVPVRDLAGAVGHDERMVERWIAGFDIPPKDEWPTITGKVIELIELALSEPSAALN